MKRAIGSGLAAQGPPAITSGCRPSRSAAASGMPARSSMRQHVRVAEVVLQREAQHVELAQRGEVFQAVERQVVLAQEGFHVGQRREDPLAAQSRRRFITA